VSGEDIEYSINCAVILRLRLSLSATMPTVRKSHGFVSVQSGTIGKTS
jgi:hypothetical protein